MRYHLLTGLTAAVLGAAVALAVVYYPGSEPNPRSSAPVLLAKEFIPAGTFGDVVLEKELYSLTTLPYRGLEYKALSDPSVLNGERIAIRDIRRGEQLTDVNLP